MFQLFAVNLVTISHGSIVGWVSPALLTLTSEISPLASGPLTPEQISWLVSTVAFGNVIGIPVYEILAKRFGHRIGLIAIGIPQIVSSNLMELGNDRDANIFM